MSLILRVDVDKPFGNSNLFTKIASKFIEDYLGHISTKTPGYLSHQIRFLEYCNSENVPGFFYYRMCTIPNQKVIQLMEKGGHKFGLHAENTRSFETLGFELDQLRKKISPIPVETFSKHGSGVLKLGKNHYPKYEPQNYIEWSEKLKCAYPFGNDIPKNGDDLIEKNNFYPCVFWIEPEYRFSEFNSIEQLIDVAKTKRVPILIHPENFDRENFVKDEFKKLVKRAKEENIQWEVF